MGITHRFFYDYDKYLIKMGVFYTLFIISLANYGLLIFQTVNFVAFLSTNKLV
jgi:hypothetical protein